MSELALSSEASQQQQEQWVELARRNGDRYQAFLYTLGGAALPETPSMVTILHEIEDLSRHEEGTLEEVAPTYRHPMSSLKPHEAQLAYPLT